MVDFTSQLIEEPDASATKDNRQALMGFVNFLDRIRWETIQFIEHSTA